MDSESTPAVLVVEDEEPILFALESYFVGAGFTVHCARTLEEAIARVDAVPVAAVIADLKLTPAGGTEGLALLDYLRSRGARTPVVILTAFGTDETEQAARALGVDLFLHKPQPLPELESMIRGLLGDPGKRPPDDTKEVEP